MRRATDALLDNDLQLAEQVIADDVNLDEARDRVEHDVQMLLALQSPGTSLLSRYYERFTDHAVSVARKISLRRECQVAVADRVHLPG